MPKEKNREPNKYQLINQENEYYLPFKSIVVWDENLEAYCEEKSGFLFGKKEVEESNNWVLIN